jgi:hypothetical protein
VARLKIDAEPPCAVYVSANGFDRNRAPADPDLGPSSVSRGLGRFGLHSLQLGLPCRATPARAWFGAPG